MASNAQPLKVLVVGGGIGGLMAATVLRQHGHDITIFERSELAQETSAAVHVAPNAYGLLKRFGINPEEDLGANPVRGVTEWDSNGQLRAEIDMTRSTGLWQFPWVLTHRVALHNALKKCATGPDGPNKPAVLKTGVKVTKVDAENGTIYFEDGTTESADVIIGADGVSSVTRTAIAGDIKPYGSGKSAFRFLVPHDKLRADPATEAFTRKEGVMHLFYGLDKRLIMYPCNNNTMMNFVAIHPSSESSAKGDDWSKGGSKEALLEVYKEFPDSVKALLSLAETDSVKAWTLFDMERIKTWTKGKTAILGDAAHPFLPHQGQGAGVAMEDAVALTALLPMGTTPAQLPERLALFTELRDTRAHRIQEVSRMIGEDITEEQRKNFDMFKFTSYNYNHDEWHNSTAALRKLQNASQGAVYLRQPVSFGPMTSPRQGPWLSQANGFPGAPKVTATSVRFTTSATYLRNLLPSPNFSFASPGSTAQASFITLQLSNLPWLGGSGYNVFGLYIHGVKYHNTTIPGPPTIGTFLPVLFENAADPITTGREELGMPKIFADVDITREADVVRTSVSWKGHKFVDVEVGQLKTASKEDLAQSAQAIVAMNKPPGPPPGAPGALPAGAGGPSAGGMPMGPNNKLLVYRYIPAVGQPGVADAEYPVVIEEGMAVGPKESVDGSAFMSKSANVKFDKGDWQKLPTLYHIAEILAELPVYGIIEAKVEEGTGVQSFGNIKRLA